jgi:hypothetical protein
VRPGFPKSDGVRASFFSLIMKAKSALWKKWNRAILARAICEELDTSTPMTPFKDRGARYFIWAPGPARLGATLTKCYGIPLTKCYGTSEVTSYSVRELSDLFDLCTLQRILKKIRKHNAAWWSMNREMVVYLHQYLVKQVEYQLTPKNHWLP